MKQKSKSEVTAIKTKKINQFTGGKIEDYTLPNYPKSKNDDGKLSNSFVSKDGTYLGSYSRGLWYLKQSMIVCNDYPLGVSIVLKRPVKEIKNLEKLDFKTDVKGYYGYSHRGGCLFSIGDKLFDSKYAPKEKDYTISEWAEFKIKQADSVKQKIKEGYSESDAVNDTPISDVIPFRMRGKKTIETWKEALKAAINLSEYLG